MILVASCLDAISGELIITEYCILFVDMSRGKLMTEGSAAKHNTDTEELRNEEEIRYLPLFRWIARVII